MNDEFEALTKWMKETRPEEWEAIVRHGNAITKLLIEFWFDGMAGKDQHRVYEVRRSPAGCYQSSISGGQEQWTTEPKGLNGEPIIKTREWVVSEDNGYIGSFETLDQLAIMILHQLGGRRVFVVSDSLVVN
jgi:hypothetical protein